MRESRRERKRDRQTDRERRRRRRSERNHGIQDLEMAVLATGYPL